MIPYKILLSYDGTHYSGWQIQPNAPSIQQTLEGVLAQINGKRIPVTASGRTDAGVHALAQVAHFTSRPLTLHSLNSLLPPDIRIHSLEETHATFHARFDAKGKEYHYYLHTDPLLSPFERPYRTYHPYPLNIPLMRQAATHFVGTHDFTTFANSGGSHVNPVKTLYRLDLIDIPGGVRFEFEGSGFLYKMVRNIVGTLIAIGHGALEPSAIPPLFAARDRRLAKAAAPPTGLFLIKVTY